MGVAQSDWVLQNQIGCCGIWLIQTDPIRCKVGLTDYTSCHSLHTLVGLSSMWEGFTSHSEPPPWNVLLLKPSPRPPFCYNNNHLLAPFCFMTLIYQEGLECAVKLPNPWLKASCTVYITVYIPGHCLGFSTWRLWKNDLLVSEGLRMGSSLT